MKIAIGMCAQTHTHLKQNHYMTSFVSPEYAPEEFKAHHGDIYTLTFTMALLMIAMIWDLSRCPLTGKQLKKIWHIALR